MSKLNDVSRQLHKWLGELIKEYGTELADLHQTLGKNTISLSASVLVKEGPLNDVPVELCIKIDDEKDGDA